MSRALAVIATDYDGTLARGGAMSGELERLLEQVRQAGLRLVLVTGRRVPELLQVCPRAAELFDRIVAENGGVLVREGGAVQRLAEPVDARLAPALADMGCWAANGEVLVATLAQHEAAVNAQVARLGLQVRLVRNRESLMVLPESVSKASGLSHALASLGASAEQTAGIGDAENDRELLEACGLGVAVGDAVPELKAVADRVLDRPNGEGVAAFLRELLG